MSIIEKLDRHGTLVRRMADTVEADLAEAIMDGSLSAEGLRSAVLRCITCEAADQCETWLAEHRETLAEATPDYCRNADMFERLRG